MPDRRMAPAEVVAYARHVIVEAGLEYPPPAPMPGDSETGQRRRHEAHERDRLERFLLALLSNPTVEPLIDRTVRAGAILSVDGDRVEFMAGAHVLSAARELAAEAATRRMQLHGNFNGYTLKANPGDDPAEVVREWNRMSAPVRLPNPRREPGSGVV